MKLTQKTLQNGIGLATGTTNRHCDRRVNGWNAGP